MKKNSKLKTKKETNNQSLQTKLSWLPAKTFELEFTIPWQQVKTSYEKNLKILAKETSLKGFRKGKAPLELVEKNLDKGKLYSLVLEDLLPLTYWKAIKKHQLQPINEPKLLPLKTEEGKDWVFKATACESPTIKLGNYEQAIKAAKAKEKIWLPHQSKSQKTKTKSEDELLDEIFALLLKECQVDLSPLLIEQEERRILARLLDQIQKLGLTLEEYCQTNQKTLEQLKSEYHELAERTLKLEFILQKIAQEKEFSVTEKEVEELIAVVPDEKTKKELQKPQEKAYLTALLRKRKAIDFLLKL